MRIRRIQTTKSMVPVMTPTSSKLKIQALALVYRVSASPYCHHSQFQFRSMVGVHQFIGWSMRKMVSYPSWLTAV